jgi:hypothetical protein
VEETKDRRLDVYLPAGSHQPPSGTRSVVSAETTTDFAVF